MNKGNQNSHILGRQWQRKILCHYPNAPKKISDV
jgi:hypothetical protein